MNGRRIKQFDSGEQVITYNVNVESMFCFLRDERQAILQYTVASYNVIYV